MKNMVLTLVVGLCALNTSADEASKELGKAVYDKWCIHCHGDGPGMLGPESMLPGTEAIKALYKGSKPALLTERTDLVPELTRTFVRNGVSIMPFFRKTEISDQELDALADYLAP